MFTVLDLRPRAGIGGAGLHGGQDPLDLQGVREGRLRLAALTDCGDQVHHLVGETVLVAQAVAGGPPVADVRVLGFGDKDFPEAGVRGLRRVVEGQDVHVLEIEGEGAFGAVQFQAHGVLPAQRVPRGFKDADRACGGTAVELCAEDGGVIHGDLPAGCIAADVAVAAQAHEVPGQRAFRDKRFEQCRNAGDALPGHPLGGVDAVRTDVAEGPGP